VVFGQLATDVPEQTRHPFLMNGFEIEAKIEFQRPRIDCKCKHLLIYEVKKFGLFPVLNRG
jgi:hypothetical protein